MATYSLVSWGAMINASHGVLWGELMRTLLLAALDAIVVMGGSVGRRLLGGRDGVGWVDGRGTLSRVTVVPVTVRDITHGGITPLETNGPTPFWLGLDPRLCTQYKDTMAQYRLKKKRQERERTRHEHSIDRWSCLVARASLKGKRSTPRTLAAPLPCATAPSSRSTMKGKGRL
jgi:hypothetical protein